MSLSNLLVNVGKSDEVSQNKSKAVACIDAQIVDADCNSTLTRGEVVSQDADGKWCAPSLSTIPTCAHTHTNRQNNKREPQKTFTAHDNRWLSFCPNLYLTK